MSWTALSFFVVGAWLGVTIGFVGGVLVSARHSDSPEGVEGV